jgi:hypothetical protein
MATEVKEILVRAVDLERLGIRISHVNYDDPKTNEICKSNAKKIAGLFIPYDPRKRKTHGPCLICGKDANILRGDGYGPEVFCCYGPGCVPF